MLTAWSTLTVETSPAESPSLSTWTRAPSRPRMIGRPTPAPKNDDCTPGRRATVSPIELALASSRRSPARTATGRVMSSAVRAIGLARTRRVSRSVIPCACPLSSPGGASCAVAGWATSMARTARASRVGAGRWATGDGLRGIGGIRRC